MSLAYISVEYLWEKKTKPQNLKPKPKPINQTKNPSRTRDLMLLLCFNAKLKEFVIVCVVLQKVYTPLLCLY